MNIIIYTQPDCNACHFTKVALDKLDLTYETVDVSTDEEAARDVRAMGLYPRTLPVVVVSNIDGGSQRWSGLRIDKIRALARLL